MNLFGVSTGDLFSIKTRQPHLTVVGWLLLFTDSGLHAQGTFVDFRHVFGAEGLGAHQAAPGCFENRFSFHVEKQEAPGWFVALFLGWRRLPQRTRANSGKDPGRWAEPRPGSCAPVARWGNSSVMACSMLRDVQRAW